MRITVTDEDIKCGVPRSACNCPVALALTRTLGPRGLHVAFFTVRIRIAPERVRVIETPENARRFIDAFDHGRPVEPFTFNLEYDACESV